jgi:hypothetical protein
MKRSEIREKFMNILAATGKSSITRGEIVELCKSNNLTVPQWFLNDSSNRIRRGLFRIEQATNSPQMAASVIPLKKINNIETDIQKQDIVPSVYKNYVPFGNFGDLVAIISSRQFIPVFITGHSGNGKTLSVEQACAKLKRKFICVSMTHETDESDLLGNYVLLDGQMVWRDGPVTVAAREGAVLCVDEIDYGGQNLSTLQRVLEGKPFLLKKKNELIVPAEGFTIIATANTKGKGSDDGRYMFTNILNEAFLERFPITFEQVWPTEVVEKKILTKEFESLGISDDKLIDNLVTWANGIRKTFDAGGCDEVISTRRLVHIARTYSIFKNIKNAMEYCLNRFDDDTKKSFIDLYSKIDSNVDTDKGNNNQPTA